MRVCADKKGTCGGPACAQFDDGLGERGHVQVLETAAQAASTVPACAKAYRSDRGCIGVVVGFAQLVEIDQIFGDTRLACARVLSHDILLQFRTIDGLSTV